MKKFFPLSFLLLPLVAVAQYQLPNPGFEQWDGGVTSEPAHWNSFASSDGTYSGLASSPHHYRRSGGRPGTEGNYFLTLYTTSIFGIKANGNMTTGRIHAGSMTPTGDENYNYTQRSNSDFCQPFSGTPDSVYVWVSFYAGSENALARVAFILHGDSDFKSPNHENNPDRYCAKAVSEFTRTTTTPHAHGWQQLRVPFVYDGNTDPAYMLINLTTNAVPGVGGTDDSLSVDDIEFIYSAWLTGISVGGHPLSGFEKGVMDYTIHVDDSSLFVAEVEGLTEVADATVSVERQMIDDTTALVILTVTAEDGVTVRHYHLTLTTGNPAGAYHLAIGDSPRKAQMKLYPNPARTAVTIEAPTQEPALLMVTDAAGRQLLTRRSVTLPYTLPLTSFRPGLYHLTLTTPTATVTRKLLVE